MSIYCGFLSRNIFLDFLGVNVFGLNTTAANLLQFINLVELGVGSAAAVTHYKSLFDNDIETNNNICLY